MTSKALVVLSGGQDSTTCLFMAKQAHEEVHAITFDYNQRHRLELEAATRVAQLAGCRTHEVVTLGPILQGRSPLTNPAEQLEQYQNHDEMEKTIGNRVELTFVPMRNTLFLTIAMNRAVVLGADALYTGVCEADNANYPDCRSTFIHMLHRAFSESLGQEAPRIETPLMRMSKDQSIWEALKYPGAYAALGFSHTAYDGSYPPTGHDHATILRAHGFEQAGVPDPLVVRAYWEGSMELPTTSNYQKWAGLLSAYQPGYVNVLVGLQSLEAEIRAALHDH